MKSEHSAVHSEIISIFKNNSKWESEIFAAIYENLEDMSSLVKNKTSLASVIGLFQLVEISYRDPRTSQSLERTETNIP